MRRNGLLALATAMLVGAPVGAQIFPGEAWAPLGDLTVGGWSASGLSEADELAGRIGTAAYLVVQDGQLVHEWGTVERPMHIHSIRKSILSGLFGIAVDAGVVDTTATLAEIGVSDVGGLSERELSARVIDLMKARSGVYHSAAYETPGMRRLRPPRGSQAPGTFFYYNNWDFNTLGSIFIERTGLDVFDAFPGLVGGTARDAGRRLATHELSP